LAALAAQVVEIPLLVLTASLDEHREGRIVVGWFRQSASGDLQIKLCQIPAIDMADEVRRAELKGLAGELHGASLAMGMTIANR
jgi:hypothetical protein